MKKTWIPLLATLAGGTAFAQGEGNNDPRKPDARVPAPAYRSAFEDYRPYREQELAPWRAVNDEVARVGGHMGVVKAAKGQSRDGKR